MLASRWLFPRQVTKPRLAAFTTSSRCGRDLHAKYRYRPPTRVQEQQEEYLTASTIPVTSSIQAVPPPTESSTPNQEKLHDEPFVGRKATPLPAMQPLHHEQPKEVRPRAEEIHNCVYTLYADDLLAFNESLANALTALRTSGTPPSTWPAEICAFAEKGRAAGDDSAAAFGSPRRAPGEQAEMVTREEIMRDVLEDVDPALRAFLE
ncbi:hypothetical protein QFC21_004177 [Naganishia friedmannii]|uniref:Uncharacterized protein n=1 Tax=Naganishia friedmannii TaxID=89922 RepID=A0ACC2VL08_9TREE|nr:hypothetical protein QFC21_004177 [Naganishia friedmannii]